MALYLSLLPRPLVYRKRPCIRQQQRHQEQPKSDDKINTNKDYDKLTALIVIPGARRGSVKFLLFARVNGPRTVFRRSSWKSIAAL